MSTAQGPFPNAATAQPTPASRRIDALRHLLKPHQLRESMALAAQPSLSNSALAGVQAALTVAIALPLVQLSPWSHLIGFASLGTLVALFGRFAPRAGRSRIVFYAALSQVLAVLAMSTLAWLGTPFAAQILLLALSCGLFFFISVSGRFGPPGALIFIFAVGASMGQVDSLQVVLERTAATGAVAALAWIVCAATERFRQENRPEAPFPPDHMPPLDRRLFAAARISVASAVAAFLAYGIGAHYPSWAAMGTVAVMQGAHLHITMNRAVQRMAGSALGAAMVWLLLTQDPTVWSLIALIAAMQVVTELVIGANYALGQILVTPMALLMTYLASHGQDGGALVSERVLDTLLGVLIGIALAILFSTLDDRVHLAHHHAARSRS